MNLRWHITLATMLLFLLFGPPAWSQATADAQADTQAYTQANTQAEIHYLLDFVEVSGCEFYRNGSWHNSQQAREHLRTKLEYLSARNRIHTAEDFIQLAASKSSMSGKPYEIRCGECAPRAAGSWLAGVLLRYRSVQAREQGQHKLHRAGHVR